MQLYVAQDAAGNVAGPHFRFVHVVCQPPETLCISMTETILNSSTSFTAVDLQTPSIRQEAQHSCSVDSRCMSLTSSLSYTEMDQQEITEIDQRASHATGFLARAGDESHSSGNSISMPMERHRAILALIGPPILVVRPLLKHATRLSVRFYHEDAVF